MARIRETPVEKYLLERCRENGLLCLKFTSPGRAGVPDRIIVAPGQVVFVELKRPGGELRTLQQEMRAKLRRHGARVYVVDDFAGADVVVEHLLALGPDPTTG